MAQLRPTYIYVMWLLLAIAAVVPGHAFTPAGGIDPEDFGDQAEMRIGPLTMQGEEPAPLSRANYSLYPFINLKANEIKYNGADWSALRSRIGQVDDVVVSIVHIGDSHLQAEGASQRTRQMLQKFYGSSGRGLVTPLKLAGTNQPTDYAITTSCHMAASSLMRRPWHLHMGFTGIAIEPEADTYDITISARNSAEVNNDFDLVKIYGHGPMPELTAVRTDGARDVHFRSSVKADTITVMLMEPANSATFHFASKGQCTINGFKLENSMTGIEYHVIGNNGARYDSYNAIGSFSSDIRSLSPNLIIISLGTNEAFGTISDAAFHANIDRMVRSLRQNNPGAQIMLVTPAECQRKARRGYQINTNIDRLRRVILNYGRDNKVATYDWYEVAGGDCSSTHWVHDNLLSSDRIHYTWNGYHLQGDLMYDALIKALNN